MEVYNDFQIRARKRARAKKNRVEFHRSRCLSRLFGTSLSLCFVDLLGLPENRSSLRDQVLSNKKRSTFVLLLLVNKRVKYSVFKKS